MMNTETESTWANVNPLIKGYVFLFVLLLGALVPNILVLGVTSIVVAAVVLLSRIPFKRLWRTIRLFSLLLIPFVAVLILLEGTVGHDALILGAATYFRFLNLLLLGAVYVLTTRPMDFALLGLRSQSTSVQRIGIAIAAAMGSMTILSGKVRNTAFYLRLRGYRISAKPSDRHETADTLTLFISSVVLQTVALADEYTASLIARGVQGGKATIPPYCELHTPMNVGFLIGGTLYLGFIMAAML